MPKYKLSYFNFRARAELARLIFAVADVEYEDDRVTSFHQWYNVMKPDTPFGQLPVLMVDSEKLCQSHVIARFLAREFGLAGKGNLQQAKADMVVECIVDMMEPIMPCYREKNINRQEEMRRDYEVTLPSFMEKLNGLLKGNNGGNEYICGDELTWADLALMNAWHWIPGFEVIPPLDDFPELKAHKERLEAHPRVAKWLEARPETPV